MSMADYSLQGLNISPEEFVGSLASPHENVCLRIISDRAGTGFSGQKLEVKQGTFNSILETLNTHNLHHRGIFAVINRGGHSDDDIIRIDAQYMEIDHLPLEEQLELIKKFPLEPSLIVKTRKSLHCYWLIKNGKVENFRRIQKRLIAYFDSDPACVNESRVMRLPGFYHCKEEAIMVECIKFSPHLRYTQEELEAVLPAVQGETAPDHAPAFNPKQEHDCQKGLMLTGRCNFIKYCKRNAKSLPEPHWYAMITNLAEFTGGEAMIHKLSKPYPNYSFEETQVKIEHYRNSGTKPMTCRAISERRFKCPKLNSCKCKSPAGQAFFPMDMNDIRKRLAACKVTNNAVDDIVTARTFISDYMFNIDKGLVETFINSEIKVEFAFKQSDLKQLITFNKEVHQEYFSSHKSKIDHSGDELPPWYELPEKGSKFRFMPSVLADWCIKNEKVFYCGDSYYFYENGVYKPRNDMAAQKRIRHYMARDKNKTSAQIADAEHQWRIEIDKSVREINVNHYLMNFKNGIYNIHTDTLSEHNPDIYSTIQLNANYTTNPDCPIFLKYLDDVLQKSEHALVQEMLGYIMIPVNKAQKSFLLVGKKDSGKSTMLYLIQTLLGEDNYSSLTWQNLDDRFSTFQLFGKLANVFADLPSTALKDTGIFKAITGEDYIMHRTKTQGWIQLQAVCDIGFLV
jgi:putative DNA primase/helicase